MWSCGVTGFTIVDWECWVQAQEPRVVGRRTAGSVDVAGGVDRSQIGRWRVNQAGIKQTSS
jgi:hypothetical protein